jgi:predicted RNase H-related nuclease YkuK (DUF458 family)|tara:strand:- start:730 stop:1203 length:474 start_codon:yes stop_codon:yes gene_type:complete
MNGWNRLSGEKIYDLEETLLLDIANSPTDDLKFYVGCDSQMIKGVYFFTTALVMLRAQSGGIAYYQKKPFAFNDLNMNHRLFLETFKAIETATRLDPLLKCLNYKINEVHTDINPNPRFPSFEAVGACLGYIKGMGFEAKLKPEAWAATTVADYAMK